MTKSKAEKFEIFFWSKSAINLSLGPHKGSPSYGMSRQPPKETSGTSRNKIYYFFFLFLRVIFALLDSDQIRKQIHNTGRKDQVSSFDDFYPSCREFSCFNFCQFLISSTFWRGFFLLRIRHPMQLKHFTYRNQLFVCFPCVLSLCKEISEGTTESGWTRCRRGCPTTSPCTRWTHTTSSPSGRPATSRSTAPAPSGPWV